MHKCYFRPDLYRKHTHHNDVITNTPIPNEPTPEAAQSTKPGADAPGPSEDGSVAAPPARAQKIALAALVVGIGAFLTGLVPGLGLGLAVVALILGVIALAKKQPKALAVTGVALGSIALVAGLISTSTGDRAATSDVASTSEESPEEAVAEPEPEPVETEEPPAAPEEPAANGTIENPFTQPYIAEGVFGGDKYSLTGRIVDANANALIKGWNQFNPDAPAGFKYVVLEFIMTGIDPDGVEPSLAAFDLSLATGEGNTYDNEFIVFGEGMSSMSDGPTLYPGSAFTGYTAHVVPESAQAFLIYDNGRFVAF